MTNRGLLVIDAELPAETSVTAWLCDPLGMPIFFFKRYLLQTERSLLRSNR